MHDKKYKPIFLTISTKTEVIKMAQEMAEQDNRTRSNFVSQLITQEYERRHSTESEQK